MRRYTGGYLHSKGIPMLLCHVSFKKAALRGFSSFIICSSQEAFSFSALILVPVMERDR